MAEITDKAALGTLADDDELAIVQAGSTYRIQFSNLKAGILGLDLQSLDLGGTGADLSATGGSSEYIKQVTSGGTFTVGAIVANDLPDTTESAAGAIELATQTEVDNGNSAIKAITPATLESNIADLAILGEIRLWTTGSAPSKWQLCDDSAISRTTYAGLFAIIGTTFGVGDGATTFNVPDFRGRFPLGVSGGHALAATGGATTHTLTEAEMPSHTHPIPANALTVQVPAGGNTSYNQETATASGSTGSGTAHENLHPYLALNFIIYLGV